MRVAAMIGSAFVGVFAIVLVALPTSTATAVMAGRDLYVDGSPYQVRGVAYSPVPIGSSPLTAPPYGDYFTSEYAALWKRDFPIIHGMGSNTLRVYGWNRDADHTEFLDAANKAGLKVLVGFYIGTSTVTPLRTDDDVAAVSRAFAAEVDRYRAHPAVLGWLFGNEVNGVWQGHMQTLSDAHACGWEPNQCYGGADGTRSDACIGPSSCVYDALFAALERIASAAKATGAKQLITASFADVDYVPARIGAHERVAPSIDVWSVSIYRGRSFGGFFSEFNMRSARALLVVEYGVDAYDDSACAASWDEVCRDGARASNDAEVLMRGETVQRDWDVALTAEWLSAAAGSNGGPVAGAFVMSYIDEYWKNADSNVKGCRAGTDADPRSDDCDPKAHTDCPRAATDRAHAICGYPLLSAPDGYSNEAWFGVCSVRPNPDANDPNGIDEVHPRLAYGAIRDLYASRGPNPTGVRLHWSTYVWFVAMACAVAAAAMPHPDALPSSAANTDAVAIAAAASADASGTADPAVAEAESALTRFLKADVWKTGSDDGEERSRLLS